MQLNYLIDEGVDCGKGSNSVVSYLHDFLSTSPVQASNLSLHADNCVGQNKNNIMLQVKRKSKFLVAYKFLQYLIWHVMTGLNKCITLSFMVVGHTKFTPDSCFGLLKQKFRRTHVQSLHDIAKVVDESAYVNQARLVGNEAGEVFVPTYDWQSFFATRMKKVTGIKGYHQFVMSNSSPGTVTCKQYSDSTGTSMKLIKNDWMPSATEFPSVVVPSGLSAERQWYLYDKIRPFCDTQSYRDITCPLPTVPRPRTPVNSPGPSPPPSPHHRPASRRPVSPPPSKKIRSCSKCGEAGHNKRSCKS